MKIHKGNLLDAAEAGDLDLIMHGCNCFHAMGGGIAGEISERYPVVPKADKAYSELGDPTKLSLYTQAHVTHRRVRLPSAAVAWEDKKTTQFKPTYDTVKLNNPFTVINLYTQFTPGPDFIPSIFGAGVNRVNESFKGKTIGIPLIGCGIGGGDWAGVMTDLMNYGPDINWEVYIL